LSISSAATAATAAAEEEDDEEDEDEGGNEGEFDRMRFSNALTISSTSAICNARLFSVIFFLPRYPAHRYEGYHKGGLARFGPESQEDLARLGPESTGNFSAVRRRIHSGIKSDSTFFETIFYYGRAHEATVAAGAVAGQPRLASAATAFRTFAVGPNVCSHV
jgi:hypothetical protein